MKIINLGEIDYQKALNFQLKLVEKVRDDRNEEFIIFCSHPAIVTCGKQASPQDITGWKGEVVNISRGGKTTYHGPGQIVVYPILDLSKRNNDIHQYLRNIEKAVVNTLAEYNILAIGNPDGTLATTGIWIQNKKVASIGIAVKRWITYHGLAINLFHDPIAFKGISPCGYQEDTMTYVQKYTEKKIDRELLLKNLSNHLLELLSL